MSHQHGDVPGPTTKGGARPANSARPGQRAAEQQTSSPAPLGYGEEASETLGVTGATADPAPRKFANPGDSESAARTSAAHRGGGYTPIPGEDS